MYTKLFYKTLGFALAIAGVLLATNCKQTTDTMSNEQASNVLLQEWEGPYQGVPAFDNMRLEDIKPALEKGM